MAYYLSKIRIDTHMSESGEQWEVTDAHTGKRVEHISKIELLIVPTDAVVTARLTFSEVREGRVDESSLIVHHVELTPVLSYVKQVHGDEWELDGDQWHYSDHDHLLVRFKRKSSKG